MAADEALTYEELSERAGGIAAALDRPAPGGPLVGLLAYRSPTAYAAMLAILACGRGYVPINPRFPALRSATMLASAQPDVIVVGAECVDYLAELLPLLAKPVRFLMPSGTDRSSWSARAPAHSFVVHDGGAAELRAEAVEPETLAYVLFTSGSTGVPKGVMVSHANVAAYLDYMADAFDFSEKDRFSHNFDLTFDLSVHDIFLPLQVGASIRCPTFAETKLPGLYIRNNEITQWFAVPSATTLLVQLRLAAPGAYPSIRRSFFCGEALPLTTAQAWRAAAPNSEVVNLYGPTEATIAITRFDVAKDLRESDCRNGVVPIGAAFPGQQTRVVDGEGRAVERGTEGELCLAGSQVTAGYWKGEEKTREQFVKLPDGDDRVWYRSGDLVIEDDRGTLHYMGRIDHQVKILGYRVELGEIEHHLRRRSGADAVAAIPWPVEAGAARGVETFVVKPADGFREDDVIREMADRLPAYMVPRSIRVIDRMPLNANGKLDRAELVARYLE